MKSVQQIDVPDWITNDSRKIITALNEASGDMAALYVGGCVRNSLLHKTVEDIDIATVHQPEEAMKILNDIGAKAIPTGIEHGTITAVLNDKSYEVTTLRKDVETDGRHAIVAFTDQWKEDAARRDFTINALYMDDTGSIYDPLGEGLKDLEKKKIRFIGDAQARIKEDYLRILRFFRFHAHYGEGDVDQNGLTACRENIEGLSQVSRERITQEYLKILMADNVSTLSAMFDAGILSQLRGINYNEEHLKNLIALQKQYAAQYNGARVVARYFMVSGAKAVFHDDLICFSKAQAGSIVKLEMISRIELFKDERAVKKAMFYHGRDLVFQGYLLLRAQEKIEDNPALANLIQEWNIPKCPITGETLLAEGYSTGPELGQELDRRREEWLEGNL